MFHMFWVFKEALVLFTIRKSSIPVDHQDKQISIHEDWLEQQDPCPQLLFDPSTLRPHQWLLFSIHQQFLHFQQISQISVFPLIYTLCNMHLLILHEWISFSALQILLNMIFILAQFDIFVMFDNILPMKRVGCFILC